jgi:primosomal protein N' (replication factor Y)
MLVNVALNIPSDKLFTYEVPSNLWQKIEIGKRVFVPFGYRKRTGFIVALDPPCKLAGIKSILEILDDESLFSKPDLDFYQWIANYFMYPLGKTLAELIPAGAEKKDVLWITPLPIPDGISLAPIQEKVLVLLQQYPQGISFKSLPEIIKLKNVSAVVHNLHLSGLLRIEEKHKKQLAVRTEKIVSLVADKIAGTKLTSKQKLLVEFLQKQGPMAIGDLIKKTNVSSTVIKNLQNKGFVTFTSSEKIRRASLKSAISRLDENITLNKEQELALAEISSHLNKNIFTPILLHGVTGSGKTEVYLHAIEEVLKNGGTAIYLVPEIALTPQLISRIAGRFDEQKIAVLHSGITESVRYDHWRQIKRGNINLIIGARSAIFAPLTNLKLIIIDEEHDTSYKQDDRLCYHARDLAVLKAKLSNATVILGSATPSIRSYFNAQTKKYRYVELRQRVQSRPLPIVEIVDMKAQKEKQGKAPILSDALISAITETLGKKEQVLLFLNKRGFDTFLVCADCGYNFRCPNCAVSLKHHLAENLIKCHYCDYNQKAMPFCPSCKGSRVLSYGVGTQKLEKEIESLFPVARLQRMDSDTTARRGTQDKILGLLATNKIDILVGTQMITKGHDFPLITLVGVIAADTSLNMPDFRAAEKTFQILTQVAGRSGRGDTAGKVIIQTFNPDHYALLHAQNHDYKSFYKDEFEFRKALQYPPFGRIINMRLSSVKKDVLINVADQLGKQARIINSRYKNAAEIIGPAESPLAKLNGRFRFQMLIKGSNLNTLHQIAQELVQNHKNSSVKMTVDVDPENFM